MWYYTKDGQQTGPVDDAALDQLIVDRTVTPETYLWKEGQADWLPLAQARPTPADLPVVSSGICAKCGKNVGADNLVDLLGIRVCSDCKPLALQSLQEGAPVSAISSATAWAEGKSVVTSNNQTLPARCYKCNCAVEGEPLKRKVYWHPPLYYVLVVISLIIYVIVAIIVRKRATVDVYLCPTHKQKRKTFILIGWGGFILAFVMFFVGIGTNTGWLTGISFLVGLVAIGTGLIGGSLAGATRIQGETVWLRGAGKDFLASLPQWPSAK